MDNEKLAGIRDRLTAFTKNLGGRKSEILHAQTQKVFNDRLVERLTPREKSLEKTLSDLKLNPNSNAVGIASTEGGLSELRKTISDSVSESDRLKGEVHDIRNSVLKARIGAGVAGGAALTASGYAAKKYYDNSIQTDLADRDKVAYFNPAPWADDVMNSYTQVKLVWEQKKRDAERRKQNK